MISLCPTRATILGTSNRTHLSTYRPSLSSTLTTRTLSFYLYLSNPSSSLPLARLSILLMRTYTHVPDSFSLPTTFHHGRDTNLCTCRNVYVCKYQHWDAPSLTHCRMQSSFLRRHISSLLFSSLLYFGVFALITTRTTTFFCLDEQPSNVKKVSYSETRSLIKYLSTTCQTPMEPTISHLISLRPACWNGP